MMIIRASKSNEDIINFAHPSTTTASSKDRLRVSEPTIDDSSPLT